MRSLKGALSLALALYLTAASPLVTAADVTVFAAASLKEAMDEQAKQFEASTGNKVVVSYGASNALAKQIEAAAPADIFISADFDWMDYLDQRRLLAPNTRVNLLRNTLVLIAPSSSSSTLKIAPNFGLAAALGTEKLAMAGTVRAALVLVSRGEAPFGIVYKTDALADKGVKVLDTFPPDSHPPIIYPAALVATSKSTAAKPMLDSLRSVPTRAVWEKYGFGLAQ